MAKKTTRKSSAANQGLVAETIIEQKEEKVDTLDLSANIFPKLCEDLRIAKIELKRLQDMEKESREKLKHYAEEHKLEKGNYHGIKIMQKFIFLESNVKIAEEKQIPVPKTIEKRLKLSDQRIQELIDANILKADEIERSEIVELKELKKKFEELAIAGEFAMDYSFGVAE
jgi:hypothetical protein